MVLQFLMPLLTGVGGKGGALSGLAQGGGFGLGYGFMVRAGYDLYGAIKDKVIGSLMGARYVPAPATSMMGTGGLMGMKHNPDNRIDNSTLPVMQGAKLTNEQIKQTPEYQRYKWQFGASNALNVYKRNHPGAVQPRSIATSKVTRNYQKQISPITGRRESDYQYQARINKSIRRQKYYNNKSFYDTFNIKY